jgi:hypothetical protein
MQSRRAIWQSRIIDGATVALLLAAAVLFFDARRGGAQPQGAAPPPALERDSRVPAVEVTEGAGTRAALLGGAGQPGHLVLFFRTDCPVCARQRPAWADLAARARAAGWAVTGVTTEPLTDAAKGYLGAGLRVVQMDFATAERLRTTVVPTTLAVSAGSSVLLHHPGLLSAAATDSITRFF